MDYLTHVATSEIPNSDAFVWENRYKALFENDYPHSHYPPLTKTIYYYKGIHPKWNNGCAKLLVLLVRSIIASWKGVVRFFRNLWLVCLFFEFFWRPNMEFGINPWQRTTEWNIKLRPKIREREKYICTNCEPPFSGFLRQKVTRSIHENPCWSSADYTTFLLLFKIRSFVLVELDCQVQAPFFWFVEKTLEAENWHFVEFDLIF